MEDNICPICIDVFKKPTTIIKSNCHHTFCNDCILQISNKTCPMCRIQFNDDDLLHNIALERYINSQLDLNRTQLSEQTHNIKLKKCQKQLFKNQLKINKQLQEQLNIETLKLSLIKQKQNQITIQSIKQQRLLEIQTRLQLRQGCVCRRFQEEDELYITILQTKITKQEKLLEQLRVQYLEQDKRINLLNDEIIRNNETQIIKDDSIQLFLTEESNFEYGKVNLEIDYDGQYKNIFSPIFPLDGEYLINIFYVQLNGDDSDFITCITNYGNFYTFFREQYESMKHFKNEFLNTPSKHNEQYCRFPPRYTQSTTPHINYLCITGSKFLSRIEYDKIQSYIKNKKHTQLPNFVIDTIKMMHSNMVVNSVCNRGIDVIEIMDFITKYS